MSTLLPRHMIDDGSISNSNSNSNGYHTDDDDDDDERNDSRERGEAIPKNEDSRRDQVDDDDVHDDDVHDDEADRGGRRCTIQRAVPTKTVCFLFSFVMFGSSFAVSLIVYYYMRNAEDAVFENQFRSDADKVFHSIGESLVNTLYVMDNFVTMMVAQKDALNATFPFVAVSNYALQAAKVKTLAKAITAGIVYLVQEDERDDWEAFAKTNNQFVKEAWDLQMRDPTFQGQREIFPNVEDRVFSNIPTNAPRPQGSGPYLVTWQSYPIIYEQNSAVYNYDIFSVPVRCRKLMLT